MKNTVKELTARQKNFLRTICTNDIMDGKQEKETINRLQKKILSWGIVDKSGQYNMLLALSRSFYACAYAKHTHMDIMEFFRRYCVFKVKVLYNLNDFGAFADIVETAVKVASRPRNLLHYDDIHVTTGKRDFDIMLRGVKTEIGTNGKTFAFSTRSDAMHGSFTQVCYGVFNDDDKQAIIKLLTNRKTIEKGIQAIIDMMYIFPDKTDFCDKLLTECGRRPMIAYKENIDSWQVIYNNSKHTAFLKMIDKYNPVTVAEYLKK